MSERVGEPERVLVWSTVKLAVAVRDALMELDNVLVTVLDWAMREIVTEVVRFTVRFTVSERE